MNIERAEQICRHYLDLREQFIDTFDDVAYEGTTIHFPALVRALKTLPDRQLQAVWLFLIRGLSDTQAAKIMGVSSRTTVRNHVRAGLTNLVGQF